MIEPAPAAPERCAVCDGDQRELRSTQRPGFEAGMHPLFAVDLFAGCGGMSLGAALAAHKRGRGYRTLMAMELDPRVAEVYQRNFPTTDVRVSDVSQVFAGACGTAPTEAERDIAEHVAKALGGRPLDLLLGGPPCQGNSDLNNRTRRTDQRNELYLTMVRAAEVLGATTVIVENVPTVRHATQQVVAAACTTLTGLGYQVAHAVVDSSQVGVPQRRKRHLLLATKLRVHVGRVLAAAPNDSCCRTRDVAWAIRDLVGADRSAVFDTPSTPNATNAQRMAWFFEKPTVRFDLPNALRPSCHRDGNHSYRSVYGRLRWSEPAQTITTGFGCMGQGRYVHPAAPRTLTPHEAARLQSFPDYYHIGGVARGVMAKIIGNAVPPRLIAAVLGAFMDEAGVALTLDACRTGVSAEGADTSGELDPRIVPSPDPLEQLPQVVG